MTIAWSSIGYAQRNILVNKRVLAWLARGSSLRPHLRVHAEIYLYIEGLPRSPQPEYLEQLSIFYPPAGKAHFPGKRGKGMSDLGFVDL
jgi:hypothetical protein